MAQVLETWGQLGKHPTGRDQMFRFKDVIYPVKTDEGYSGEIRRLTMLVGAW